MGTNSPITRLLDYQILLGLVVLSIGCQPPGRLTSRASDEWKRSYNLDPKAEIQIANTNGRVEIEGVDGSMLDIVAERSVRGATEQLARDLLPRVAISDLATSKLVKIDTQPIKGLLIGASFEVNYHVRSPRGALVRVRTANGPVALEGLIGRVVATTSNGPINGRALRGGVEARTVNGRIEIALDAVGDDPIELRAVNGSIQLALPATAKANLSVSAVNGSIETPGLNLDLMGEQSGSSSGLRRGNGGRRVRGRLNGGGTPIEITTVNGKIEITGR